MHTYRVDDMTCGHCASTITKALRAVDTGAEVEVDLGQHLVRVESSKADPRKLSAAITGAGYTPVSVDLQSVAASAPKSGGCCCGNGASSCRT
ncbi:heavy-metal-associated domain-containing protein [Roseateles sp.]|uniref:heavy-metal-associated domain-containing protein n=1 Tax=Roseateles sp. TaxID=1971397 RepID=UPI0032659F21